MKVESEPDQVDHRFVLAAASVSAVITLMCCGLAWLVLRGVGSGNRIETVHQIRARKPPAEVNQVESDLFAGKQPPAERAAAKQRLSSFGWTAREQGIVHIPLARAFDLYLAGARAQGAPTPSEKKR